MKISLFGIPGAGKSTTSQIMLRFCADENIYCRRIRLADPLYECQKSVYSIAGKPLTEFYDQDGELLNFFGGYLRKINPTVLTDSFLKKLKITMDEVSPINQLPYLIICDDMRRPEYEFMLSNNFKIVKVYAPREMCIARRSMRGDLRLGEQEHVTEWGLDEIVPDFVIDNTGLITELDYRVHQLLRSIL